MPSRPQRHALITEVLAEGPVPSQDALLARLLGLGVRTTQATLSRDLRELGVVKGPEGYLLPGAPSGPAARRRVRGLAATGSLERVVGQYVVSVKTGVGLVVLKTGPGHAQVVALELDRVPPAGVIGTVGGDDTVFVAVSDAERVETLASEMRAMAGLIGFGGEA